MVPWLRALLLLQMAWIGFSAPTWWLTDSCRKSDALISSMDMRHTCGANAYMQNTHRHKINNPRKNKKEIEEMRVLLTKAFN